MFGLTSLGIVHTLISLVAVAAGIVALVRDGRITYANTVGKWYVWTTIATCVTGFGIFQHGGFGKPHALGVITLLALGLATVAARTTLFGRVSKYVEVLSYSATFLFHWIPAITETTTRLPLGAPLLSSPDAPALQKATAALLVLFLAGATWQVLKLRKGATDSLVLPVGVSPGG
jgi:uncharacterized membrane protein